MGITCMDLQYLVQFFECVCLISSLLMFGSASLFIIKDGGHVSSMKSVKKKENHLCGEGGWGEHVGLLNIFEEIQ